METDARRDWEARPHEQVPLVLLDSDRIARPGESRVVALQEEHARVLDDRYARFEGT